jgi:cytochrome P450
MLVDVQRVLFAPDTTTSGGCPHVTAAFDPLDPEVAANPYPHIADLRRDTPVFEMPQYGMWCVTRHADIREVLRDPVLFSNAPYANVTPIPEAVKARVGEDYIPPITSDQILTTDPPRHTRLRKVFQPSFTPRAVARHEPAIRDIIDELIDTFINAGETDFVESFATPLPLTVIGLILGLPPDRRGEFRGYVEAVMRAQLSGGLSEEELLARWETILGFDDFFRDFLADRRENPGDDVASVALHAPVDPTEDELSDRAISSSVIGLAIAGADTTTILLSHMVYLLLSEPDRWDAVNCDRSLLPAVVEETLRVSGPVVGLMRQMTAPGTVGGVELPKGSVLYLHIGSGNHDDAVFEDPDSFVPERAGLTKHLAFGTLTHACMGAPLARLQGRLALERLLDRLPSPRLAEPGARLEYVPNLLFPQVQHLRLRWDPTP